MKKLKLLIAFCALMLGWSSASAETDYTSSMPSGWTGSNGDFGGGRERYQGANYESGKIMYQSFTAPAAGIYEIKFYAVTSSTSGRGFTNIYGPNIAQAYATAGENKATVAMTVIDQTGCTLVADANIRTLSVEAAAGETIEYGIENIATGGNWYTIKALSAKMKTVAEIFQSQYDEAYAIWEHSTENVAGAKATFKTYVDAMNTALTGTLAEAQTASDNLAAALVTYESQSYPVKGSGVKYDFTSKMNMAIDAWTCKQGNGPAQYGFTGATETYKGSAYAVGEVMYQTISGLANGEYEIHFYAVANSPRSESASGDGIAYVYANDQTTDINVIAQDGCTPSEYERTFTVMVTDGTIKYGLSNKAAGGNWYVAKNVALYMTGAPDLSDYYEAIAGKLTTANGLKSSPMKSTVLSALQDAIDATEGYTDIAVIGTLETMSDNLTTAINNANTSISNYEDALSVLNAASNLDAAGQAYYAANETVAGIQSAYDARTLEAVTSDQKTACAAVLPLAARAQTSNNADWTAVLVNPSFETNDFTGWSNNGSMAIQGNTSFPLKDGSYYAEFWQPNGTKGVTQTVDNIAAGVYSISAKALARGITSARLFAAGEEVDVTVGDEGDTYTVEFLQSEDGSVTFGFEGVGTGATSSWICVDNFTMKFVRPATAADYKEFLSSAISAASGARKAANEGTGVFQIPAFAGATLASAIEAAQSVFDNGDATISDVKTAVSTLNTAVETYEATTLNAPAAGTRYYLTVATSGHSKENNAIVVNLGATSDNNKTGYGFAAAAEPKTYMAQALIFTQVSENNYKISVERPEGMVYFTYGSLNNSAAGWATQQIQGTTDASSAGEFKIVATATANVFNIYNTVYNDYIDCQDGGSLYTDTNIDMKDFTLSEASKAEVAINIASDVKYATRIFPFTPVLPSGVVAYSCEASNGNELTLVEVVSPAANVPYILYAEEGCDATLTGWGTAAATSYTEGWLTGVYESTTATAGTYVLQNNDKVAFYLVEENEEPTVGAYRCYLTKSAGARAAFFFPGSITGVNNVAAAAEAEVKDGKYIENGKVVIVKNGKKFSATGAQMK